MKAVRIFEFGGPEVLQYGDYPDPELGPHDVLVRVRASSISLFDIKYRKGLLSHVKLPGRRGFPMPMQLGRDAAGVVEAVGAEVKSFAPGDRVIGLVSPLNPFSDLAIMGLGNLSTGIDLPGHTMFGSNAELVSRPDNYWLPLPSEVDWFEGAAALWSYATARRLLMDRIGARADDSLLVIGASGGMGSATVDLARTMGLRIIAVTRSRDKEGFLLECGADAVVVLEEGSDPVKNVREAAGGLGVDSAIDFAGSLETMRLCIDSLRPGGTFVPIGGDQTRDSMPITVADCVRLELNIRGGRGSTVFDQKAVLNLLKHRRIKPAIDKVLPLAEIRAAHEHLERGGVNGRIILEV